MRTDMDFSQAYRGVQWFGLGVEEAADAFGIRDAMAILAKVPARTEDEDLRHDRETLEALDYLTGLVGRLSAATAFQAALSVQHPAMRRKAVTDAYRALCKALSVASQI